MPNKVSLKEAKLDRGCDVGRVRRASATVCLPGVLPPTWCPSQDRQLRLCRLGRLKTVAQPPMKFHPGWNQRSQSRVRLNYSIDADLLFAGPNKSEFDAKIVALNDEVQDFNERLSEVDAKISEAKCSGGNQSEELREARATMKSLRERKDAIMRDRAEIATLQKSAKASLDSKITVCARNQLHLS